MYALCQIAYIIPIAKRKNICNNLTYMKKVVDFEL